MLARFLPYKILFFPYNYKVSCRELHWEYPDALLPINFNPERQFLPEALITVVAKNGEFSISIFSSTFTSSVVFRQLNTMCDPGWVSGPEKGHWWNGEMWVRSGD